MHRKVSLAGHCSAKNGGTLCRCVFRPCPELPNTTLTAAQAAGLTGTPRETSAALQIPSQLLWAGTGFTEFCNILSVSVTAKTEVQPKCCPEHLSEWEFCIWTFRFGPFQVSLGILSQPSPNKVHLMNRRVCDHPEGLPGASSDGPRGTHQLMLGVPPLGSALADLQQHLSIPPFLLLPRTPPAEPR